MTEDIKTEHSPLPWHDEADDECRLITDAKGRRVVALTYGMWVGEGLPIEFANAALIVKAVNCHEKLVAALKDIAEAPALPWMERAQLYEEIARRALEKANG